MKLCEGVHCLRIDFYITPQIKRFVFVYILTGTYCYLIDTGVHGAQQMIEAYLKSIGYHLQDIRGVFLTHAHPDHMGSAAAIQKITGCRVYGSIRERAWIEDPSRQYRERPIPNFHLLLQDAVTLTDPLEAYANITLENHMTLEALSTPGHSQGSMSFLYNGLVLFSGDAIPVRGDIPIYTNVQEERAALKLLSTYRSITYYCPAWDHVYRCEEGLEKLEDALCLVSEYDSCVREVLSNYPKAEKEQLFELVCEQRKVQQFKENPLFRQTVYAHIAYCRNHDLH